MEGLVERIARRAPLLAEGSIYELLRRNEAIRFDPRIAHAGLIYDRTARRLLAEIHLAYAEIAARHTLPILALTDTWRASASRVAASPFAGRDVNRENVEFLRTLLHGRQAFLAGLTGPAGDAYRPEEALPYREALAYHEAQIAELARAGVDLLFAATLPNATEGRAIGKLMAATGVPWMVSFVVRRDGTILDGMPLADAIAMIDAETATPPIGYALNCVHASTAAAALSRLPAAAASRMIAFQGNASALSPEELDGRAEIDSEPAPQYAEGVWRLARALDLPIAGGCCGTSPEHMEELADRIIRDRAPQ